MNHKLLRHTPGTRRLVLFFAGWGMDPAPFVSLAREGYDIALLWDYRALDIDWAFTDPYDEICVVAWSMGVVAASLATAPLAGRITRRVALNGTPVPVSDTEGIPAAIFRGTLERLDPRNLAKFHRRMFSSRGDCDAFLAAAPARPLDGLRDELDALGRLSAPASAPAWDTAYIGLSDAIFPPDAQRRAWESRGVPVVELDAPHWLDFNAILRHELVDKSTMAARFAGRRDTYERHGSVQADVVCRLCDDIADICGPALAETSGPILEIGSGSGSLSRRLARMAPRASLTLWDIAGDCPADLANRPGCTFRRCDAELAIADLPDDSVPFIFSASTVQWFNSPARFFDRCARVLAPGGILALSTFTAGNLAEIAAVTGRSLPVPDPDGWIDLAARRLTLLRSRAWTDRLHFPSAADALRHLSLTGVNSLGGSARAVLRSLAPGADGRYPLTYRPMILILRKP